MQEPGSVKVISISNTALRLPVFTAELQSSGFLPEMCTLLRLDLNAVFRDREAVATLGDRPAEVPAVILTQESYSGRAAREES